MITSIVLLVWIIASFGFGYLLFPLFTLVHLIWIIPTGILAGLLVSAIFIVLFVIIHSLFFRFTSINSKYKGYTTRSICYFVNRFLLRISIVEKVGFKNIPKTGKLTIYANHKSMADALVISEIMNRPVAFTPKKSIYKVPILASWLRSIGCMPIDRDSDRETAKSMIKAIKDVKNGLALTIFPEGGIKTRDEEQMVAMRAGAYKIALKAEADILPITIIGNSKVSKNAPFRKTKIKIIVHDLIKYDDIKDVNTNEIANRVFNIINDSFTENED